MLKAKTTKGDLILCVDKENVKRLKQGKPIFIEGAELGLDYDIFIMYGETLADIADQIGVKKPKV